MANKNAKTKSYQGFEAWQERKREFNLTNTIAHQFQKMWRRAALTQRAEEGRLTDKNMVEMATVGLHFKRS
jgi:hypothetical protein